MSSDRPSPVRFFGALLASGALLVATPTDALAGECSSYLQQVSPDDLIARLAGPDSEAEALRKLPPDELDRVVDQHDRRLVPIHCLTSALDRVAPSDAGVWLTEGHVVTPMDAQSATLDALIRVLAVDPGDSRARAEATALVGRMDQLRGLPEGEYDWARDLEKYAALPFDDRAAGTYAFAALAAEQEYDRLVAGTRAGAEDQLGMARNGLAWAMQAEKAARTTEDRAHALELELAITLRVGRSRTVDLTIPPYRQGEKDSINAETRKTEAFLRAGDLAATKLSRLLPRDGSSEAAQAMVSMTGQWARFRVAERNEAWEDYTYALREGAAPDGTPPEYDAPSEDVRLHRVTHRLETRLSRVHNTDDAAADRLQSVHAELLALETRMAAQKNARDATVLRFLAPHRAYTPTLKEMTAVHIWNTPAEHPRKHQALPAPAAAPGPLLTASVCTHLFSSPVVAGAYGMVTHTPASDPFGSLRTTTQCR